MSITVETPTAIVQSADVRRQAEGDAEAPSRLGARSKRTSRNLADDATTRLSHREYTHGGIGAPVSGQVLMTGHDVVACVDSEEWRRRVG